MRSSRNARRHGLSVSIFYDKALSDEVKSLSIALTGGSSDSNLCAAASEFAEAQIDLKRIRRIEHEVLIRAMSEFEVGPPEIDRRPSQLDNDSLKHLVRIDRYTRRALSRRKAAMRDLCPKGQPPRA